MRASPSIEAAIERWVRRLEHIHEIERCRVVIEHARHDLVRDPQFHVRLAMALPAQAKALAPGAETIAQHEDVYVAVSNAFRAGWRQLIDVRDRTRRLA